MKEFFDRLFVMLPASIARGLLLGHGAIASWYSANGVFRFPVGSQIVLANAHIAGYGVEPVGTIIAHTKSGNYIVDMERDVGEHLVDWIHVRFVPNGVRKSQQEIYSKQQIEFYFREAPQPNPLSAYAVDA